MNNNNNINIINLNISHIIKNTILLVIFLCYVEFTYKYKPVGNNLFVTLNLPTNTDL